MYLTEMKKIKYRKVTSQAIIHTIIVLLVFFSLFPLVLTLYDSFKSYNDYSTNMWLPSIPFRLYNYNEAFRKLWPYMLTTMIVAIGGGLGMLFISSIASYAIGKIRFKGSNLCYMLIMGLMMLPGVLTLIPQFNLYKSLGLVDTYWALIFPVWSNGCLMSVFLLVTFMRSLPKEVFEAAKIDGASEFKQYYRIAAPLSAPTIGTCAIIQIVAIWNDYLWPKTIQTQTEFYTIPQGILYTYQNYANTPEMYAGYIIAALPLLILFIFANKFYIEGLTGGAVKM